MITNATTQAVAPVPNDIRDIKPPIDIPNGWAWLWWGLAVVVVAVAAFLIWRWRQSRKADIPLVPRVPSHIRARQKLAAALALIAQPKPFVIAVSDAARAYLEERFNFHAPERTTEEFLVEAHLPERHMALLRTFLVEADLVKFARHRPGKDDMARAFAAAENFVRESAG